MPRRGGGACEPMSVAPCNAFQHPEEGDCRITIPRASRAAHEIAELPFRKGKRGGGGGCALGIPGCSVLLGKIRCMVSEAILLGRRQLSVMAGILAARPCLRFTPSCGRSLQNISLRWRKRVLDSSCSMGFHMVLGSGDLQASGTRRTHPRWLGTSALSQHSQEQQPSSDQFRLIYRFPGIRYCRAVSRLKLLQTALTVVVLPPVWFLCWQNQVTQLQCLSVTGIACFAAVMLYGMSFYLRRIIGMMYLNEDRTLLKVAHLTFWGKRKDIYCPVESVMTLSDVGDGKNELLFQFRQHGRDEFFYFTLRFGEVVDREGFLEVFGALH